MVTPLNPVAAPMEYGMVSERSRRRMVERLKETGITDERVLGAMHAVPRHLFIDEAFATRAYDNVALPIGFGQTISQPATVARMTEALLKGRMTLQRVLEVGTGCGYQTAILLKIAKEVYSVERVKELLDFARRNLKQAQQTQQPRLVHQDGRLGLEQAAPFDGIIVTAASTDIPHALIEQLAPGGRLIIPIGGKEQFLWLIEKTHEGITKKRLDEVTFVPLLIGRV